MTLPYPAFFAICLMALLDPFPLKARETLVASPLSEPIVIPMRDDIRIDGSFEDWSNGVYTQTPLFAENSGRAADPASHAATVRFAWNAESLLLAVTVKDEQISEAKGRYLWIGDALVTLVSSGFKGEEPVLFMLTPGQDANGKGVEPRTLLNDHRKSPHLKSISAKPQFACHIIEEGYQMELAFPLQAFGLGDAKFGDAVSVQLDIKDRDNTDAVQALEWHPYRNSTRNPDAFMPLVFGDLPDSRPSLQPKVRLVDESTAEALVFAEPSLAGQNVEFQFPTGTQFATLEQIPGQAYALARSSVSYPQNNDKPWPLRIRFGKQVVGHFDFTDVTWVSSKNNYAPVPSLAAMLAFEEDRRNNRYSKDAILVIGSSSVRMWKSIKDDLAPYEIIHRGFGGSSMGDVVGAYQYLIEPYQTDRYLIYEGDTDSVRGDQAAFLQHVQSFIERVSKERPEATIAFITPKPSPARAHLWETNYREAREGLFEISDRYQNVHVIDVAPPLLDENGKPREDLYLDDRVHFNEEGYKHWTQSIRSQLQPIFGPPKRTE